MSRVKRGVTKHARHKKNLSTTPKAIAAAGKTPSASPIRQWKRPASTPIAIVASKNAISAAFGSSVLTLRRVSWDLTYGRFIHGLDRAGIEVDRKVLADIAVHEPEAFKALAEKAKAALA